MFDSAVVVSPPSTAGRLEHILHIRVQPGTSFLAVRKDGHTLDRVGDSPVEGAWAYIIYDVAPMFFADTKGGTE